MRTRPILPPPPRSYFDWETGKTDIRYRDCHQYSLDDAEQTPFPPKARTY